jgi:hypothetical protein
LNEGLKKGVEREHTAIQYTHHHDIKKAESNGNANKKSKDTPKSQSKSEHQNGGEKQHENIVAQPMLPSQKE